MKNIVKSRWKQVRSIEENEKQYLRHRCFALGGVLAEDTKCFRVFEEMVRIIIAADYPDHWSSLGDEICSHINTQEATAESLKRLYVGVSVLLRVAKVFQGRSGEGQKSFAKIVEKTFPIILSLGQSLLQSIQSNNCSVPLPLAISLLKKICHAFFCATRWEFPDNFFLSGEEFFQKWCKFFVAVLALPPPDQFQGNEDVMRIFWAMQKRCISIAVSFSRRRRPSNSKKPLGGWKGEDTAFDAIWTQGGYLSAFTQGVLNWTLSNVGNNKEGLIAPGSKVVNVALMFMSIAVRETCVFHIILHDLEKLLSQVILPVMRLNIDDQMRWDEDPVGYVRRNFDCEQIYYDPRESSCEILHSLAEFHRQETITPLLTLISNQMTSGDELAQEASMRFIGNLVDLIAPTTNNEEKRMAAVVAGFDPEQMLQNHVLPCIDSTNPFLRFRAIAVYGDYASFLDTRDYHQHLAIVWNKVVSHLDDSELPVRAQAALTLKHFLRSHDGIKSAIVPTLAICMKGLFKIMNEIDLEELPECLAMFIEYFPKEIAPFGHEMALILLRSYIILKNLNFKIFNSNDIMFTCE